MFQMSQELKEAPISFKKICHHCLKMTIVLYLSTAVLISASNLIFLVSLEMGNKAESFFLLFPCLQSDLEYNTLFLERIEIGCLHLLVSNFIYEMSCMGSANDGSY